MTVKDFLGNPVAGSTVVIDFSGCPDIQISCDQLTGATGQISLTGKKVAGSTDASGQFTFKVQGASNAGGVGPQTSPGTPAGVRCALVWADGVPLASLSVDAYDLNGLGSSSLSAVDGTDVALTLTEVLRAGLTVTPRARHDYSHDGHVNSADLSVMLNLSIDAGLGTGSRTTSPYCP